MVAGPNRAAPVSSDREATRDPAPVAVRGRGRVDLGGAWSVHAAVSGNDLVDVDSSRSDRPRTGIGNAGTRIAFRLGSKDSAVLAREFAPRFEAEDFLNLPNFQYYLRLLINGQPSLAFSAETGVLVKCPSTAVEKHGIPAI